MREFRAKSELVWAVAFSPDGRYLVAGGWPAVRIWDTNSAEQMTTLLENSGDAMAVRFHPSGVLLVSRRGKLPEVRSWPGGAVTVPGVDEWKCPMSSSAVDFTPQGMCVFGSQSLVQCRDPINGKQVWGSIIHYNFRMLRCGPGNHVAVVRDEGWLDHHNASTGERVAVRRMANTAGEVRAMAFSPDGRTLALSIRSELALWHVPSLIEWRRVTLPAPCTQLEYRPDGSQLYGFAGGAVRVWEPDTLREVKALDFGINEVNDMTFAPDGNRAAIACEHGRVVVWDLD